MNDKSIAIEIKMKLGSTLIDFERVCAALVFVSISAK